MGTSQRFFVLPFRRRSPVRFAVALLLLWALGCGANRRSFFGGDVAVRVDADPEINQNSPVAVEMVVVGARSPGEVDENERLAGLALPPELWQELGFAGHVRS